MVSNRANGTANNLYYFGLYNIVFVSLSDTSFVNSSDLTVNMRTIYVASSMGGTGEGLTIEARHRGLDCPRMSQGALDGFQSSGGIFYAEYDGSAIPADVVRSCCDHVLTAIPMCKPCGDGSSGGFLTSGECGSIDGGPIIDTDAGNVDSTGKGNVTVNEQLGNPNASRNVVAGIAPHHFRNDGVRNLKHVNKDATQDPERMTIAVVKCLRYFSHLV